MFDGGGFLLTKISVKIWKFFRLNLGFFFLKGSRKEKKRKCTHNQLKKTFENLFKVKMLGLLLMETYSNEQQQKIKFYKCVL